MKYIISLVILFSTFANAEVWLTSSNKMAKNDLQFLASRGIITAPVTTYPIVWDAILPELKQKRRVSKAERLAINRLLVEYNKANKFQLGMRITNESASLPNTSYQSNEKSSIYISGSFDSDLVKAKLSSDVLNGDFDGSYLALQQSGWLFYLSRQEQFWGPTNDASLIYSDYAQAQPALGIQRASAEAFDLPVLNWLGPWSFKAQMSQMEDYRAVPETKMWSTRFNFKPVQHLEIGLSHVALWGGEGFGNGVSDFVDVISGKEYCIVPEDECTSSHMSKFGNQLAAIDANLHFSLLKMNFNLYGQVVGEDAPTSGILPADKVSMYGLSVQTLLRAGLFKMYFETIDSNLSCRQTDNRQNCLYEHSTYQSGYRYKGIPIGSPYDNDSISHVLGFTLTNNQHFIEMKFKKLSLNEDSANSITESGLSGHYLVAEKTELTLLEYSHQYDWSQSHRIKLDLQSKLDGSLPSEDDHILQVLYQYNF